MGEGRNEDIEEGDDLVLVDQGVLRKGRGEALPFLRGGRLFSLKEISYFRDT